MDAAHFDRWTRSISRRTIAGAFGLGALGLPSLAEAKRHKRKKKKKRVTFNDFGCVNVGSFCKNSGQCCSGICHGKKDKKKCKAHDTGGCLAGQGGCGVAPVPCTTSTGADGQCYPTTGQAGFCGANGGCADCTRDAECGPSGAACIPCNSCMQGTACVVA